MTWDFSEKFMKRSRNQIVIISAWNLQINIPLVSIVLSEFNEFAFPLFMKKSKSNEVVSEGVSDSLPINRSKIFYSEKLSREKLSRISRILAFFAKFLRKIWSCSFAKVYPAKFHWFLGANFYVPYNPMILRIYRQKFSNFPTNDLFLWIPSY